MTPDKAIEREDKINAMNGNRLRKIIAAVTQTGNVHVSEDGIVNYFVGAEQYQAHYNQKRIELKTYGRQVPPQVVEYITKLFPKAPKENKTYPSTGTHGQDTTLTIHTWHEVTPFQLRLAALKATRLW